jgi:fusaric acid resistance family protein
MRNTLVIMVAVLATYGSALLLDRIAGLQLEAVITAVVLALTLARTRVSRGADRTDIAVTVALLPAVAVAAWGIGRLLGSQPDLGGALLVIGMSVPVWMRRFGDRATRMGTLIVLPLVASLIVSQSGSGQAGIGWTVAVALIACGWVTAAVLVATRTGFIRPPALPTSADNSKKRSSGEDRPRAGRVRRMPATTRMALQLGVALSASFLLGRMLWPQHWTWVVISAFVVCSGTRGRGDVLYKGILRAGGAVAGTLVATGVGSLFGPRADATVILIFVAIAAATWLRTYSYAYWAAIVTGVISLLYSWFGLSAGGPLHTRLCGLLLGAGLAVAICWLLLPVRTGDVLRRRVAEAVGALRALLGIDRSDAGALRSGQAAYARSIDRLGEIAPPLRAQRRLFSRWLPGVRFGADAVDALARCADPVSVLARTSADDPRVTMASRLVCDNADAVRRAIGRRPGVRYRRVTTIDAGVPELTGALREIDDALGKVSAVFAG